MQAYTFYILLYAYFCVSFASFIDPEKRETKKKKKQKLLYANNNLNKKKLNPRRVTTLRRKNVFIGTTWSYIATIILLFRFFIFPQPSVFWLVFGWSPPHGRCHRRREVTVAFRVLAVRRKNKTYTHTCVHLYRSNYYYYRRFFFFF